MTYIRIRVFIFLGALLSCAATPTPSLNQADSASLLREFSHAQKTELKALEHRQKFELKELKASQEARRREWEKDEKDARYKFFADHPKGSDRRAFIQDFIQRRDTLIKQFLEERKQRMHEHEIRLLAIKQDQGTRLRDFKKAVEKHEKPAETLWPRAGH